MDELIDKLFEQKGKLFWLTKQIPTNEEQRQAIEVADKLLERVDELLRGFGYELPT